MMFSRVGATVPSFLLILLFAASVSAQTGADIQASVRAAILNDPRTAGMSQAQIDQMVEALSAQAQEKGVTSHDIAWRPQAADGDGNFKTCGFLCSINRAFGFDGSAPLIPILLGASSMLLIVLFGFLLEHYHFTHLIHPRPPIDAIPPVASQ